MANLVTYAKQKWEDAKTAITAARLNHMEDGINDCATQINALGDSVSRTSGVCYSSNLNDIVKPGVYHVDASVTLGKPSGAYGWGFLLVFASAPGRVLQVYVEEGAHESTYRRNFWDGGISPWVNTSGKVMDSTVSSDQTGPELS